MAIINLDPGQNYTIARIQQKSVILDSSNYCHATKVFGNQVLISGSNITGVGLNLQQTTTSTGVQLNMRNLGTGDSGIGIHAGNRPYSIGVDNSDNDYFKIGQSSTIGGSTGLTMTTGLNPDVIINNDLTINGNLTALNVSGTSILGDANTDNTTINGRLLAGTLSPTSEHILKANVANGYVVRMHNDGNNSNRFGLRLQAGLDNQAYPNHNVTNYYMRLDEGDGGVIAYVTALNKNVTWGTFTGVHDGHVLTQDNINSTINENTSSAYETGTIVVTVKSELSGSYQPDHYIVSSSIHQDKRVIGVYYSVLNPNALGDGYESIHSFASLGDGPILVCSQNGNIENGDYITTASGSGGYGCKQNDDLLHNYTVAKALEDVDWSTEPNNTKLISCTYHCG